MRHRCPATQLLLMCHFFDKCHTIKYSVTYFSYLSLIINWFALKLYITLKHKQSGYFFKYWFF
jgi:hypothetical protein